MRVLELSCQEYHGHTEVMVEFVATDGIEVWGHRYFWKESITRHAELSLPHAHVEIHSVTVSEKRKEK